MATVKAVVSGIQIGRRFLEVGETFDLPIVLTAEEQAAKWGRVLYVPVEAPVAPVEPKKEGAKGEDTQDEKKPARRGRKRS